MTKRIFLILFSFGLLLFNACYYDNAEELYPEPCDTNAVTYNAEIAKIMSTHCTKCHPGVGPGNFTTYQGVFNSRESIKNEVVTLKKMPPTGPISDCEQKKLETWINAGAPNN